MTRDKLTVEQLRALLAEARREIPVHHTTWRHRASGAVYVATQLSIREHDLVVLVTYRRLGDVDNDMVPWTRTLPEFLSKFEKQ